MSGNSIHILDKDLSIIKHELKVNSPFEACGVLVGLVDANDKNTVRVVCAVPIKNSNRTHRSFELDPAGFYKAWAGAEDEGLDIVGIYHTHPLSPARPSAWDLEYMQQEQNIWMIAGADGIFAYRWKDGGAQAVEII